MSNYTPGNQGNSPQAQGNHQTQGNPNAGSTKDADKEKRIRTEDHNPGDERTIEEAGGTPGDEETADLGDENPEELDEVRPHGNETPA